MIAFIYVPSLVYNNSYKLPIPWLQILQIPLFQIFSLAAIIIEIANAIITKKQASTAEALFNFLSQLSVPFYSLLEHLYCSTSNFICQRFFKNNFAKNDSPQIVERQAQPTIPPPFFYNKRLFAYFVI